MKALVFLSALLMAFPLMAAEPYKFDKSHTRILFYVNHLGYSDTVGEFTDYDGVFTFDQQKPETSSIDVTLKSAGIKTPSPELDAHLQKEDFFNVAKFPDIRFVSKSIKVTGANTGEVTGDLTLLGVTKPVVLKVRFNKADFFPMGDNYVAGFAGTATIKRSDFGMSYGLPMVSDEVRLEINTELVNQQRKKPATPAKS